MANPKIRALFFWSLATTFLIVAPVIVFYAMGYRFSPERGIFVYSGSVTLKTNPRDIEVLIDNERVAKGVINFINRSYHIDGLSPGEYSLEVKSDGYESWSKNISIHSGVSTEFWNIFLAKKNYSRVKHPSNSLRGFYMSPDSKRIALVEGDDDTTVRILDVEDQEIDYSFFVADYPLSEEVKENIEWSPREGHLTVPLRKNGKQEYFIVDIGNEEVINLNNILRKDNIRQVRWSAEEKNTVFYIFEKKLYKIDLDKKNREEVLIAENIAGYDVSGDDIYYFNADSGLVYEKNSKGEGDVRQVSFFSIDVEIGEDFKLIAYDEDRVAIISQNKDLYLFNNSEENENEARIEKIKEGVEGIHFSNDGKKIAFWNNHEIFVYFIREWETQPNRSEGDMFNIVHYSSEIDNVGWFRDYEHIMFTVGDSVKIAELDHRSMRNIHDLFQIRYEDTKIRYTPREDNIFFIDFDKSSSNKLLYSISLEDELE
jgi:dipeptidyl aminopeptidase/acylaminoacyl peptidase